MSKHCSYSCSPSGGGSYSVTLRSGTAAELPSHLVQRSATLSQALPTEIDPTDEFSIVFPEGYLEEWLRHDRALRDNLSPFSSSTEDRASLADLIAALKVVDFFEDKVLIEALGKLLGSRLLSSEINAADGRAIIELSDEQADAAKEVTCLASETAVAVLRAADVSLHRKLSNLPRALNPDILLATFPELTSQGTLNLDCCEHPTVSISSTLAAALRVLPLRKLYLRNFSTNASLQSQPKAVSALKELAATNAPLQALCQVVQDLRLQSLKLCDAEMSIPEFESLVNAVAANNSLTHLELSQVAVFDSVSLTDPAESFPGCAKLFGDVGHVNLDQKPAIEQPCIRKLSQVLSLAVNMRLTDRMLVADGPLDNGGLDHLDLAFCRHLQSMTQLRALDIGEKMLGSQIAALLLHSMPNLASLAVSVAVTDSNGSGVPAALKQLTALSSLSFMASDVHQRCEDIHLGSAFLDLLADAVQHAASKLYHLQLQFWTDSTNQLVVQKLAASMQNLFKLQSLGVFINSSSSGTMIEHMLQSLPANSQLTQLCLQAPAAQLKAVLGSCDMLPSASSWRTDMPPRADICSALQRMPAVQDLRLGTRQSADLNTEEACVVKIDDYLSCCTLLTRLVFFAVSRKSVTVDRNMDGLLPSENLKVLQILSYREGLDVEPIEASPSHAGIQMQHLTLEYGHTMFLYAMRPGSPTADHLTSLTHLQLNRQKSEDTCLGTLLQVLQRLTRLRVLSIHDIGSILSDDISYTLPCLVELEDFTLKGMPIMGPWIQSVCNPLPGLTKLQKVALVSCQVTDESAQHLGRVFRLIPTLTDVDLSNNRLSDVGVGPVSDGLQDALNLRSLNLAGNPTKDLAVVRILELLHVLPTLVDVQLDMRKAAEASAHDLLSTLKRDELRCIMLRKACQHRITPGL